ncbi:hypothetical protein [Pumilibacter muris]|uniref:hypothetical protein n=1 Tax=Pumilibacter muris TaxID=2941510 RepID=UPI00203F8104|nr:hypothetical protein [Pumilibacter muris]
MQQNYLYPFLWITGESTENLAEEIDAIYESGARGFCVESRTCADFCGEKWWRIMDAVLYEAKARGMQVWLLDDKHYPTGYANDAIKYKEPDLRPWRVKCEFADLEGETGEISLLLNSESDTLTQDEILGVFAVKKRGDKAEITADLSERVEDDFLRFTYNGKPMRICTVKKTRGGAESANNPYYLDLLNPDSVDVLIREVYEPHYNRYVASGKYAGTFCGFFSDEPRFANGYNFDGLCARNAYHSTLGVEGMAYPWNDELLTPSVCLCEERGDAAVSYDRTVFCPRELLSLWYNTGENTPAVRIAYMNAITLEYGKNFSGRLSEWCHARNLTYCGHIIEDMGAHARLGCSAGHYFRSQTGADYAAIDVVLHQIKPYYTKPHFAPVAGGYADPEFFDNTLAKLASSCARLYPEKKGKALCEIFGAYGWGENINEMLYLVNHMLVRGVNSFIPHAYSQSFPNADCPPHFGKSTYLFGGYKLVMQYMQNMCEILEHEKADIKVAILYHAEAEWSGKKYMPVDTVAAALAEKQIDYDILPNDKLGLAKNYEYIIVPYAEYLSEEAERKLQAVTEAKVLRLKSMSRAELNAIVNNLPKTLRINGAGAKRVRVMKFAGKEKYFLHNEGNKTANLQIVFAGGFCKVSKLLNDAEEFLPVENGKVRLRLRTGQAAILESAQENEAKNERTRKQNLPFIKTAEDEKSVTYSACANLCDGDELLFEYAGEWARITVGGKAFDSIGGVDRIAIDSLAKASEVEKSRITVTLFKNLTEQMRDDFSKWSILRPAELKAIQIIANRSETTCTKKCKP